MTLATTLRQASYCKHSHVASSVVSAAEATVDSSSTLASKPEVLQRLSEAPAFSPVHSATLAQHPGSLLDADKDAHTSVSDDAGAVPFTILRLTSVHRTKNILRQS